jgi:tetratricopeptide (TPR) repeat protein
MSAHLPETGGPLSERPTAYYAPPTRLAPAVAGEPAAIPVAAGERYVLKREIASGGMGRVFLAEDTVFHRDVAVKILRDDLKGNAAVTARFLNEALITGQLQHPGIPPVHDLGTLADGRPFLAMKLIKGDTLDELQSGPPSRSFDRLAVFEQVCQAVGYAHERGVIHRDIKPGNIMVGAFGEVQVMDWGLAKLLAAGGEPPTEPASPETEIHGARSSSDQTKAGSVFGTPGFMSPEQAWGEVDKVDRRSDVFGLGALLCVLLTGHPPYLGADSQAVKLQTVRADLDECFARLDGCGADPELIALCKWCLSGEQANRPADGGAVAAAVRQYRLAKDERARQAEVAAARAAEQRKRVRMQAAFAAVAVGLAGVVGGGAMWVRAERQAEQLRVQAEARQESATKVSDTCVTLAYRMLDKWRITDAEQELALCEQAVGGDLPTDALARLSAARKDAAFAARLDAIRSRFNPAEYDGTPEPYHDYARREYQAAFRENGFGDLFADPQATVALLKASPISRHLLAALDNWMFNEPGRVYRSLVWAISSGVGKESWRLRVATDWRTPEAVKRLLADTPPADRTPALYDFVGSRLEFLEPEKDTGRAVFVQGYTQHPDDPWLYYKAAAANARRRDYPRAVMALRTMLAIRPESAYGWRTLAWMQRVQGLHPAAAVAAEKALTVDANDWRAHLELALAVYPADRERARAEYTESSHLAPNSPWPHRYRGRDELFALQFDHAADAYREAVRRDPKQASDHAHLGHALLATGDLAAAEDAYQAAIRLNAKEPTALWSLAVLAAQAGNRDRALELAAAAHGNSKSVPLDQLHERYVGHLLSVCNPAVAVGMWEGAAAKHPVDPHAAFVLGLIHFQQGRFADAARMLTRSDELGRKAAQWPYQTARWAADARAKAQPK